MKKYIILVLSIFFLTGCGLCLTMLHPTYDGTYKALTDTKNATIRIFNYPYPEVYEATIKTLNNLRLFIYKKDFDKKNIYARYHHYKDVFAYAYLFSFKPVDNNYTEVTLKGAGAIFRVNDKDMLDKYLKRELESGIYKKSNL